MDVAFAKVNEETVQLLKHHHCEVIIPVNHQCCGSLPAHTGDLDTAKKLARQNCEIFSQYQFDYIVMNSAGCSAFMKQYGTLFNGTGVEEYPQSVSKRVMDLTEFLLLPDIEQLNCYPGHRFHGKRIAYHDACHLVHGQGIKEQPRKLIQQLPGMEFCELPESTWCCGSAGTYNLTHYDDSMKILARKMGNIKQIHPDVLVTGNPGCLLQLQYGIQKEGLNIELLHTATFLRSVYLGD